MDGISDECSALVYRLLMGLRVQRDITNCADTRYEDIPEEADHRNELGKHGYSITKEKGRAGGQREKRALWKVGSVK